MVMRVLYLRVCCRLSRGELGVTAGLSRGQQHVHPPCGPHSTLREGRGVTACPAAIGGGTHGPPAEGTQDPRGENTVRP